MNQFSHADFRDAIARADLAPADLATAARFATPQHPAAWQLTPLRRAIVIAGIATNCTLWTAILQTTHALA